MEVFFGGGYVVKRSCVYIKQANSNVVCKTIGGQFPCWLIYLSFKCSYCLCMKLVLTEGYLQEEREKTFKTNCPVLRLHPLWLRNKCETVTMEDLTSSSEEQHKDKEDKCKAEDTFTEKITNKQLKLSRWDKSVNRESFVIFCCFCSHLLRESIQREIMQLKSCLI